MTSPSNNPLSEDELDYLQSFLEELEGEKAMNLEEVDGFFTSLICSPELTPPSQYWPEIMGAEEMSESEGFKDKEEAEKFFGLLMQHWNSISFMLRDKNEAFTPIILENFEGKFLGNDWARGFLRGMKLHYEDFAELMNDEEHGGVLIPILALAHENDPDPKLRPYKEPIDEERRKLLIIGLSAGAMGVYGYFAPHREETASGGKREPFRREPPKVGRNEPCPCKSGKKFKVCCGKIILN